MAIFDGMIDEVYIYNRALAPSEVAKYAVILPVEPSEKLSTIWGNIKSDP